MTWYNDPADVESGRKKQDHWTRRITEKEAVYWEDAFQNLCDYRLSKGMDWNDKLVIERAPIGAWGTIYEGEPMSVLLQYQQMVGGG
jgi:hypothetical protein